MARLMAYLAEIPSGNGLDLLLRTLFHRFIFSPFPAHKYRMCLQHKLQNFPIVQQFSFKRCAVLISSPMKYKQGPQAPKGKK